jgi:outer membrane receptor for ferric coprogen and ferric-rhodotorulic acid
MAKLRAAQYCALGVLITCALPSFAAEPASAGETDQPRQLGAIKVYSDEEQPSYTAPDAASATGLSLSLRDTPQPVTVITRERIEDQAMTSLSDVLRSANGVSVQAVDRGRRTLSVRGFEVDNFQFDGIPTSLYIDNDPATALFERVEIVRGATGLLNGAGDPSATVNLVRKRADSRDFAGAFDLELGSWNQVTATADLSTPLNSSGSIRGRWVAHYDDQDAFLDYEHTRTTAFYGVIEADLGERTLLRVGATDQSDRRDGVLWAGLPYWYADGSRTDWSRSRSTATRWNQWDVDDRNYFAGITHTFANDWTLRANASYTTNDDEERMLWMWNVPDRDSGLGMEAYPYHYLGGFDQHHFDVIASGPFQAWGREHEITVGIMQSKLDETWSNRDAVEPVASFPVGDFNEWDGSFAEPELGDRYEASRYVTTQVAAYAAARLQLSDPLKLIVGARVENWEMDAGARVWVPEAFTITHDGVVVPYAGIVYDLDSRYSLYASYTSIFKAQELRDRNGDFLDPLEGNSFEAGVKAEFLEGRLFAAAGVFRTDQDNFGVEDVGFFVPPANTEPAYRAAQGVEAQGYELELAGELTLGWHLSLGWTHYSAKDAEDNDVAIDDPRKQLKLFTKYRFGGGAQGLSLGGGVNWSGAQPARAVNPGTGEEELIGQRAYAVVDLMARYEFTEKLGVQLNIDNALDEEYVSRNTGWWGGPFVWGTPRSFGVSVAYSFE